MENHNDYYIEKLERELKGLPPRKEITLPTEALLTKDQVYTFAKELFNKHFKPK